MMYIQFISRLKLIKAILYAFIFLLMTPVAGATEYPRHQIESAYILRLASQINWPESKNIKQYNIHIVSKDLKLIQSLKTYALSQQLKHKPIKITSSTTVDIPTTVHIIFIDTDSLLLYGEIYSQFENQAVLLISNSLENQQLTMINLVETETSGFTFEINKANIINHKLVVSPDIILLGGTEIDIAKLFKQGQSALAKKEQRLEILDLQIKNMFAEKIDLDNKIELLRTDNLNIAKLVKKQEIEFFKHSDEIINLKKESSDEEIALNKLKIRFSQQQNIIEQRKVLIESQNKKMESQAELISSQNLNIQAGKIQLSKELERIRLSQKTITQQRIQSTILLIILLISILMAALLYASFRKQKKTSRKLNEATTAAKIASEHKSMFLAHMSHELRTPLNSIQGFSELLLQKQDLKVGQQRFVETIKRSGQHLLSLVNNILDMSKIEAGKMDLDLENTDFHQLINDVSTTMEQRATEKGLVWRIYIEPDVPHYINADSVKIKQILLNLISNAIKYTEKGEVSLVITLIKLKNRIAHINFRIKDTGSGLSTKDCTEIFQPFVQLDNSKTQIGTGLGLTISKNYASQMNGNIFVKSKLHVGSVFDFNFKTESVSADLLTLQKRNKFSDVLSLMPDQKDFKMLVVDDNRENVLLLEQLLTSIGFKVRIETNGADAIKTFVQWNPDLIWMDWRMPIMDGLEATTQIRKLEKNNYKVKIILLTANAFKEHQPQIIKAGCDGTIYKPYQPATIYKCIADQLGVKYQYKKRNVQLLQKNKLPIISAKDLNLLPDELKISLIKAATELDLDDLVALTDRIDVFNPVQAQACRNAIKNYDVGLILSALTN